MNADVIFFSDRISGIDWIFMGLSEHKQEDQERNLPDQGPS